MGRRNIYIKDKEKEKEMIEEAKKADISFSELLVRCYDFYKERAGPPSRLKDFFKPRRRKF